MTFPLAARRTSRRRSRSFAVALLIALAAIQLAAGLDSRTPELAGGPTATGSAGGSPGTAGTATASTNPGGSPPSAPGSGAPAASPSTSAVPGGPPSGTSSASGQEAERGIPSWLPFLLDTRLAELRAEYGIPGVSATILFRDGTRWTGVGGLADVGGDVPVRPGTPFALASISKTFTSALVMQLVEEGKLTLAEPAAPHLVGLPGVPIDRQITIAQLLDHTSGLRDFLVEPRIEPAFAANPDAIWSPAKALAFLGKPVGPPGEKFLYSNTNYLLLGLIVEQVTGRSMAANLRARFFDPLGLRTAIYQAVEKPVVPLARAYRFATPAATEPPTLLASGTGVTPFAAVVTAAGAAGSVAAASPDVALWARSLYTGKVLSMASVARMVDDVARPRALDPALPYGLGVQVLTVDGRPSFGHSGRYLGARSVVRYFPQEGLTIAVLTNQSRTDPAEILVELLRLAVLG